jgi:hypothetical protein
MDNIEGEQSNCHVTINVGDAGDEGENKDNGKRCPCNFKYS